jgi:hypothetical protein
MAGKTLRRAVLALALAVPSGAAVAASSEPAHAFTLHQACQQVTGAARFTPGLTNTPTDQQTTITGNLRMCRPGGQTGGYGTLTSNFTFPDASCSGLVTGTSFTTPGRVNWGNGTQSRVRLTARTQAADPTLARITGTVISGKFAGDRIGGQVRFTPVFNGTGEPCSNTNRLKRVTFTNQISDTQRAPLRIFVP